MVPALISGGLISLFLFVMYGCWRIYDYIKGKEDDK